MERKVAKVSCSKRYVQIIGYTNVKNKIQASAAMQSVLISQNHELRAWAGWRGLVRARGLLHAKIHQMVRRDSLAELQESR